MKKCNIRVFMRAKNQMIIDQLAERIIEVLEKHGTKAVRDNDVIDILNPTSKVVDALLKMEVPEGADINIELQKVLN